MSFPRYPAYKPSGVEWLGEVPEHWEVFSLKRKARLMTEKTDSRSNPVALENVESWTGRLLETDTEFQGEGITFEAGDLLFGKLRPYLAKVYLASASGEAVGDFHVIHSSPSLLPRLLQYHLLNREVIDLVNSSTYGAKMPRASWSFLGSIEVPVPPLYEQPLIATFLDRETAKVDALIAEQQRLIELLQEKRQAVISQAVTKGLNPDTPMKDSGVEWLGEVPEHWEVMGLTKAIGPVIDYRGRTPAKRDSGTLLVTARNIRNGKIDYALSEEYVDPVEAEELLQRGRPKLGDVLFTMEAPLGQVALVDREDIALAQRVVKFRAISDRMTNSFLMWWLIGSHCQYQLNSLSTGSTALGIKASKLSAVICVVPPVSEQQAIDAHVRDCNTRFSRVHVAALDQIELLQERRSALISAAVTGQIDVRGLVPEASAA
jgi:type I restriction enzyme S subunit